MNKSMKWSWFEVPVKVEQINEYLFSDTVQSQKNKYHIYIVKKTQTKTDYIK